MSHIIRADVSCHEQVMEQIIKVIQKFQTSVYVCARARVRVCVHVSVSVCVCVCACVYACCSQNITDGFGGIFSGNWPLPR